MKYPRAVFTLAAAAVVVASVSAAAMADSGGGGARKPLTIGDPPRPPGPPAATRPVSPRAPASATVTLVTGDRVRVDTAPSGSQSATVVNGGSRAATFVQFGWNGDRYVIPATAAPYLSGTLDPRLFDVSYLVRAKLDDAHATTLPVHVRYRPGSAALPAIHAGSENKAQARAVGDLLARQWQASRTGQSTTPVGQLDGVTRISLTQPSGAPALPAAPTTATALSSQTQGGGKSVPFHTLTLNPIDRTGQPGVMLGFLQNVDDAQLSALVVGDFTSATPGPASFSVPEGTYSAEISVMSGPVQDLTVDSTLVVQPQFDVRSDETINLDARTAKPYQPRLDPSITTPVDRTDILTFTRSTARDQQLRVQAYGFDGVVAIIGMHLVSSPYITNRTLYATPTPPVTKGRLGFMALTELTNGDTASPDPTYRLVFPDPEGIPNSLTYPVARGELTTVRSHIYGSPSGTDNPPQEWPVVYLPWTVANLGVEPSVTIGQRTDYWYSSAPDITVWQDALNAPDGMRHWDARRIIAPGQQLNEDWTRAPLTAASAATYEQSLSLFGDEMVSEPLATLCAACRQDDNAMLYLQGLGDADSSHYADGSWMADTSSLRFTRDGTLALTSDSVTSGHLSPVGLNLPLLPQPASYGLDWTWSRPDDPLATVDTDWQFRSSPTDPASTLPANEHCAPDLTRGCTFLPLLFLTYDLPLDDTSHAPAGAPFRIAFTVAHQQNAPAAGDLAATVSVSYDGGTTWTDPQAAIADGSGRFSLTINHPALADTDGYVALRVRAHDDAGNSVTQTIIRAYGLTA
jgi:hypothetical protein